MSNVLRGAVANPEKVYGKSAYEIAVMHGFEGTEEEWIAHLESAQSESLKEASDKAHNDIEEAKQEMLSDIELAAEIVQTTGNSETAVMSQKAVTDEVYAPVSVEFESGLYNTNDGAKNSNALFIRTPGYLDKSVGSVKTTAPYVILLYAFYGNGKFAGMYRSSDDTIQPTVGYVNELDLEKVFTLYPTYKFTLAIKNDDKVSAEIDLVDCLASTQITSASLLGRVDVLEEQQKAMSDEFYEQQDADVAFENGYYATGNGLKGDAAAWIRTVDYLDEHVVSIATNSSEYGMILYVYNENGTFLGLYRATDGAIFPSSNYYTELDIATARSLYPEYKFTISVKRISNAAIDMEAALSTITAKSFVSLREMASRYEPPKKNEYIGFEGDANTKIIPVDKKTIYVKVTEQLHNSLSFYGVRGADRIPLLMQSVDTGASAFYVSYSGTFKINVDGYTEVEMRRENGAFVCDVYLVDERNVVFSTIEKRPANAYPIMAHGYKEFEDAGVAVWGMRNGKLLGSTWTQGVGVECYEIDIETGSKTKVGETISVSGSQNARQCEILDNGAVMFLLRTGSVVRCENLNDESKDWEEVHSIQYLGTEHLYDYGSFRQIDSYKNIVLLSEYKLPAKYTSETDKTGRKLFLSEDYGKTFRVIFDLADHIPSVVEGHIHSIAYDRYDDIIWVVTGDTYDMIYFSKDLGETWYQATKEYKDCNVQMTSIIPLADCVLFGTDCPILGVARYNKPTTGITDGIELTTRKGTDMKFDFPFYITPRYIGTVPVASRPAIDYEKSIAYFGYTVSEEGTQGLVCHGEVYATNGHVFKEVYRADNKVEVGTVSVYGDFDNNRCIAKHNKAGAWVVIDTK